MAESSSHYEGIPLDELPIHEVDWTHRADYIRTRSSRRPGDFDVEPEWATEAVFDPFSILGSTGGTSIKVVGLSTSAPAALPTDRGRVLKVWIVPKSLDSGAWWGASACEANKSEGRRYWKERGR